MTLALCFTESSLNYDVVHKGALDKNTVGLCGIKDYWINIIPELNENNINSLIGGDLVLNHLLDRFNGDMFKALAYYKGSKKNFEPVHKVIRIYKEIK